MNDNRDQPAMEPLAPDATEAAVKNAEVAVRLKTNGDPRKQLSGSDDGFVFRLILPFEGRLLAIVSSSATTCLWELFRRSRTPLRGRPETVRLHPGTGVHLHPGILFGINPEHCSESSRNRVHLAPDSPPIGRSVQLFLFISDQHDLRTMLCEPFGHALTAPAASAGDDGRLALQKNIFRKVLPMSPG